MPDFEYHPRSRARRLSAGVGSALLRFLRSRKALLAAAVCIALCGAFYELVLTPPAGATMPTFMQVRSGETLEAISQELQQDHLVRSAGFLKFLVRVLGGDHDLKAGVYYFGAPQDMLKVAWRLRTGDFELNPVRVLVKEGETAREIASALAKAAAPFDVQGFLAAAQAREGYLYPDTYYVYPGEDPMEVERQMEQNFQNHLTPVETQLAASGKPLQELLIMASILVGEARTDQDRRIVSGILWRRLAMGIPLQVDAPFGYVLNKPLTKLTSADLRINSPYNTYIHKGLPPTPIGNPSIEALLAAAQPTQTRYLFYLSDPQGNMHYSVTYAQHEAQVRMFY